MRPRGWLFALLPLVVVGALVLIERWLLRDVDPAIALNGKLPETTKRLLEMNADLAKLFISISTAVIGGVAYYLKSRNDEFTEFPMRAVAASAATIIVSVLSIFFGHLWIVGMRNQLADDQFQARAPGVLWPERLQYVALLLSLCWFGLLVIEREATRAKSRGSES